MLLSLFIILGDLWSKLLEISAFFPCSCALITHFEIITNGYILLSIIELLVTNFVLKISFFVANILNFKFVYVMKNIKPFSLQLISLFRSSWIVSQSSEHTNLPPSFVSSLNFATFDRSLISKKNSYTRKVVGARSDPWGTPIVRFCQSDTSPFQTTHCWRSESLVSAIWILVCFERPYQMLFCKSK